MLVITIVIILYITTVIVNYFMIRELYKRRWHLSSPELVDLVFVFFPFVNMIVMIVIICTLIELYFENIGENTGVTKFMKKFFRL